MGPVQRLAAAFDAESRLRLRGFAFKLFLIVPVSVVFAAQHHGPVLGALAYFCYWYGLFSGFCSNTAGKNQSCGSDRLG
jgi:hypothetical protein